MDPRWKAIEQRGSIDLNRTEKSAVIERLKTALADVPAVVVTDFKGLTVEQVDQLRSEMRKAEVSFEVVKNTLVRKALEGTPKENLNDLFRGNSAIAFHVEDPAAPAKILTDFAKDNDKLALKGGWVDGKLLDVAGVEQLSKLPGKDELRGRLLSVFMGAPTKLVRTLIAGPTTFARVLQARSQQLEG